MLTRQFSRLAPLFFSGRLVAGVATPVGILPAADDPLAAAAELAPKESNYQHWLGQAYIEKMQSVSMFKKTGLATKARAAWG